MGVWVVVCAPAVWGAPNELQKTSSIGIKNLQVLFKRNAEVHGSIALNPQLEVNLT